MVAFFMPEKKCCIRGMVVSERDERTTITFVYILDRNGFLLSDTVVATSCWFPGLTAS